MKACLTYRLRDNNFESKLNEAGTINMNIIKKAGFVPLEDFAKDPIEMTIEEFKEYYENLKTKYGNNTGSVLVLKGSLHEEKKNDEVINDNEGYHSIDRKLKAEARKKAKEEKELLVECEKIAKLHLEELYKNSAEKLNSPEPNKELTNE